MISCPIKDVFNSADRHKLFILRCGRNELPNNISFIEVHNITVINIGKELAMFIDTLEDYKYLNIDTFDFIKKLLDNKKTKPAGAYNNVIAIYNLGILFEPALELKATQLLKEFSKSTGLIIIWENQNEQPDVLQWITQQNTYFLDFSDTPLKILNNAI